MAIGKRTVFSAVLILWGAAAASAQMGMRMPQMHGVWNPVVGSGSAYQMEGKDGRKTEMEIAVVGTEMVAGKPGFWVEIAFNGPREGQMAMKHLMVLDGKQTQVKRVIMQAPGQPPMEMSVEMMARSGKAPEPAEPADFREHAQRVGTESVTTPAGTFTCEHWRLKDDSGSADVWFTDKVAPWGLVKTTGRASTMTLVRVISNAKSRITGTPQKFDPMEMMRRQKDKE